MLQELLDKIAVVAATLFASEFMLQFAQDRLRDTPSSGNGGSDNFDETAQDRATSRLPEKKGPASSHESTIVTTTTYLYDESENSCEAINADMRVDVQCLVNDNDTPVFEALPQLDSIDSEENVLLRVSENPDEENTSIGYGTISNKVISSDEEPRTLFHSCNTSLYISCTITLAVIPVSLFMIAVLYLNVNTSSICCQQMFNNNSLPPAVMKYVIIGHDIDAIVLNFWFQLMLVLLFGWKEFKSCYSGTLLLGFILGLTVAIFKTTLFFMDIDFNQPSYRYPGNAVFLFGVVYSSYVVTKRVCKRYPSDTLRLRKPVVFAIVSTQFVLGFFITMAYSYVFVPLFRQTKDEIGQAIVALITPTLILVPMVISENLALKSLPFTDAGHIFVLVYFVNGASILLYCIMQAGVKDLNIFIALSVFGGIFQIFQTATVKIRQRIFTGIWRCLERKCHCSTPHRELDQLTYLRRLRVDKEIQIMLYQSIAIILSQAHLALYLVSNFHVKTGEILEEFIIKRVFIGLGMSFVANYISIFLHIHWLKTKLTEVWNEHWKLHLLAITLVGVMSVCYFTGVLLNVFENFAHSLTYSMKDCTVPFQ